MNAYPPSADARAWQVVACLLATLLVGYAVTRLHSVVLARSAAWSLVIAATLGIERLCADDPAGFRMLAIIGTLLFSMKAVVTVEAQAAGEPVLSPLRWFAFASLWVGMRPAIFARSGWRSRSGAGRLIGMGIKRAALGFVLVWLAHWIASDSRSNTAQTGREFAATALVLTGLSLLLHFGIFNIVAGFWRYCGVDARSLFRAPLLSKTLAEFWGRRWNLAFSEMTAVSIYRPVVKRAGKRLATLAAFAFSGLLHELAISVAVKVGFGLPMLYFAIQGVLVSWEPPQQSWLSRVRTLCCVALPLPLLFNRPFLEGVVWPLLGTSAE